MKAESVEGVIDAGGIESTVSIHPSVFDICGAAGFYFKLSLQDSFCSVRRFSLSATNGAAWQESFRRLLLPIS